MRGESEEVGGLSPFKQKPRLQTDTKAPNVQNSLPVRPPDFCVF